MRGEAELRRLLRRLDGRGYKAYQELRGRWRLGAAADVEFFVDRVQADPFAAPSRVRLRLAGEAERFPAALRATREARVALADLLARRVAAAASAALAGTWARRRGSGRSGLVAIDAGGQEILERSAVHLGDDVVEARIVVGLPASGRQVLGDEAERLLLAVLPALAEMALRAGSLPGEEAARHVACAENHAALVAQLAPLGLVAFLADGAILPRESGASPRPLRAAEAVPLVAPDSLRVELELPHPRVAAGSGRGAGRSPASPGRIAGLGLPEGVTVIVGGGYHGKSTLLRALERGVHPHVPGDGRELVATTRGAVKVRAEDGRRVSGCDIHAFVADLPHGRTTRPFSSDDASGSTSQAAAIVEALEAGATALLLDEDTSATNFLVRDARMQALVPRAHEPITPFVDRVRELYEKLGVSTLLVMGGSGDYLDVADTVLEMRAFAPRDVTAEAQRVAAAIGPLRRREVGEPLAPAAPRVPIAASVDPARGRHRVRVEARGRDALLFGEETVDLRAVEQIADASQVRAIGFALAAARERFMGPGVSVAEILDALDALLDREGLDGLTLGTARGDLARPRRFEIAAALARLRTLRVEPATRPRGSEQAARGARGAQRAGGERRSE
jgi:predicted ABC-class ATPase